MFTHQPAHTAKKTTTTSTKQQRPHSMTLTRQTHPAAIIQRATAAPESLTTADVLQLQRTIGNRAVGQLLSGIGAAQREPADHGSLIQAKLTINPPGDVYEQEADRVAGQVVDRINQPASQPAGPGQAVQRQPPPEEEELLQGKMIQRQPEEEEELLQGKMIDTIQRQDIPEEEEELQMMSIVQREPGGGIAAAPDLEAAIQRARGSGQPLSRGIRAPMEQAFGADFGGVKVHTGAESDTLNRSIQARAFTTGQDVFFRQGAYDPGSRGGKELLAHELTHVVQQSTGRVSEGGSGMTTHPTGETFEQEMGYEQIGRQELTVRSSNPAKYATHSPTVIQRLKIDSEKIEGFKEKHTSHGHLLKGLDAAEELPEEAIIGQLIENFYKRTDFKYTPSSSKALWGSEGDCATLRNEFVAIANECFGIKLTKGSVSGKNILVRGGGKIVDSEGKTGNVDNGKHWFFGSHSWAEWEGRPIDVLFGQLGVVGHEIGKDVDDGDTYPGCEFTGMVIYRTNGLVPVPETYTTNIKMRFHW